MKIFYSINSKGISVLFLVIAMMLMVTIGYVLSYLIPTKQKSVSFVINSTPAFFLAQSGVEYAVRYATDQGWTTPASLLGLNALGPQNLGRGNFTITYDSGLNTLTSVGEIPNASQRRIAVSNFTSFLTKPLILDPGSPSPCWVVTNQRVRFYIKNVGSSDIILTAFTSTWTQTQSTTLRKIFMGGIQRYSGTYQKEGARENLDSNHTITPAQTIQIEIEWQHARVTGNIVINFYSTTGERYTFNLNPTSGC